MNQARLALVEFQAGDAQSRGRGDRACPPQHRPDAFQHPSGRQSRYPCGARKADRGEAPGSFGVKIDGVRSQTRSVAGTP